MLVVSYNPGYQNILKSLKPSTRQRFLAVEFDFPAGARGGDRVAGERPGGRALPASGPPRRGAARAQGAGPGGVSTRLLVYCATLISSGMRLERAVLAALIEPLTDDPDIRRALLRVVDITLG